MVRRANSGCLGLLHPCLPQSLPLGAPHLVAHPDHGDAEREQRDRQEVLHLAVSQRLDIRGVGRALDTAVPAPVVVRAVAVVLPVRLVVLGLVGDEVVEREAVVTRHEVDALLGLAFLVTVDLWAAHQPVRDAEHRTRLGAEEGPDVVAEPAIPLLPAVPIKLPTW